MGNHDPSLWTFPFFLVEARDGEFMAKIKRREIGDSKVGVNDHEGSKMYRALESVFFAFKALPGGQIRSVSDLKDYFFNSGSAKFTAF